MDAFVDLLLAEAKLWTFDRRDLTPRTIFFGGGTPSLLPAASMQRLIVGLKDRFDLSQLEEWTIEINPATADLDYLKMLRAEGVDRLSFGAQSFDRDELKTLERHHDPADVENSIAMARQAGFQRLNVDLIYAIPNQTLESWRRSLDRALLLQIDHLSCYGLTYESNTPMTVRKRLGQFTPSTDELELQMYKQARDSLAAAGIEWYEISNYARAGQECRHNLIYWTGGNYIGLGPSAASHVDGHRFKNLPHLREWEQAVPTGQLPVVEHELLSPGQRISERILLQLRLRCGIDLNTLEIDADERAAWVERITPLARKRLISITPTHVHLLDAGLAVADAVALELAGSF